MKTKKRAMRTTISAEMKDLIHCLKAAGISKEDSLAVCLMLSGMQEKMDELSMFMIQNRPTPSQIMEKAVILAGRGELYGLKG